MTDPLGLVAVDGSRLDTFARATGDICEGSGLAKDTVAGGARYEQTSAAVGYHTCTFLYFGMVGRPLGQVDIIHNTGIDGQVELTNQHAAGAALGYCRASSTVGSLSSSVLTNSVAETRVGVIGDLSGAYCGETFVPNVQLGNGLFTDSDTQLTLTQAFASNLVIEHRTCAFIRVSAARVASSAGAATAQVSMSGGCNTLALLGN